MVKKNGLGQTATTAWKTGESLFWQVVAALAVWGYVVALHWRNDGLWYQGDAPVHAANGLFWWDFLTRLPVNPLQFALSYYVRYPVINPTAYPPAFYLLEGALYQLFGLSPFVAKGLVLGFVLLATMYLMIYCRRWISDAAGWVAILFVLQPTVVTWGHAVMLNLPSMALGVAALYHWRYWLEDRASRHIHWAVGFALLGSLSYLPTVVVVLVMFVWALATTGGRGLLDRRVFIAGAIYLALLVPWAVVAGKWEPGYREVALYLGTYPYWKLTSWAYYLKQIPRMITVPMLLASLVGFFYGLSSKRWRKEVFYALSWFVVCYLWFSVFSVKEPRYILLLVPPIVLLGALGIFGVLEALPRFSTEVRPQLVFATLLILIAVHLAMAFRVPVPRVSGFREIVTFLQDAGPDEWVFYDGVYNGVFSYYFQLGDRHFARGVVRGNKLLYVTKINPEFGLVENVSSLEQVVELLQQQCGCKFLVVERNPPMQVKPEIYLRQALTKPQFRLLRTFHTEAPQSSDIDVYQNTGVLPRPEDFEFRFPVLGEGVKFRVKPITRQR